MRLFRVGLLTTLLAALLLFWMSSHDQSSVVQAQAPSLPIDQLEVTQTIPISRARRMALSPDNATLYVLQMPDASLKGSVSIIDTATNHVVDTIPLDYGYPLAIVFSPDGNRAYICIRKALGSTVTPGSNRIEVVDTATHSIIDTILLSDINPYGAGEMVITSDGSKIYVPNGSLGLVRVIDTTTNTISNTIPMGSTAAGWLAITPDNSRVYVMNGRDREIEVIDTVNNTVVDTIQLNLGTDVMHGASISITPDGKTVYASVDSYDSIAIIDIVPNSPTYNQQINLLATTGVNLRHMMITPNGSYGFVTNDGTSNMLIVDTNSNSPTYHSQIGTVDIGYGTFDVVFQSSSLAVVYVLTRGENGRISVINPAPLEPQIEPYVEIAGGQNADVLFDNADNLHLIYTANDQVYFKKYNQNYQLIIPETLLFDQGVNRYVRAALDQAGYIHLAWQTDAFGGSNIMYMKLDLDGNEIVAPMQLTTDTTFHNRGPKITTNSQNQAYVNWGYYQHALPQWPNPHDAVYAKIDADGTILFSQQFLAPYDWATHGSDIQIDNDDNLHVIFGRGDRYKSPSNRVLDNGFDMNAYYKKFASDGQTPLIPETLLANTESQYWPGAANLELNAAKDKLNVVLSTGRLPRQSTVEVRHLQLDLNGNVLIPVQFLSAVDNYHTGSGFAVTHNDDLSYIFWQDAKHGNYEVYYMVVNTQGQIVVPETRLTDTPERSHTGGMNITFNSKGDFVWSYFEDGNTRIVFPERLLVSSVDLSLTKTVNPPSARPGEQISYTLTFSNSGDGGIASQVVITDSIPVSLTVTGIISAGDATIMDNSTAPNYRWNVANLASGEGGVITITGLLSTSLPVGTVDNTAFIAGHETETHDDNNSSTVGLPIAGAILAISPTPAHMYLDTTELLTITLDPNFTKVNSFQINGQLDPAILRLVDIHPSGILPIELDPPTFDPLNGAFSYGAGLLGAGLTQPFAVLVLEVQAVATTTSSSPVQFLTTFPPTDVSGPTGSLLGETRDGAVNVVARANMQGAVLLQGRPIDEDYPAESWVIPITIQLIPAGTNTPAYTFTTTTDQWGKFKLFNILPAQYDIMVKGSHTLGNIARNVSLVSGANSYTFGELVEGDIELKTSYNQILSADFGILSGSFNKCHTDSGFVAQADLNEDDCVSIRDFGLLSSNYLQQGNIEVTVSASPLSVSTLRPDNTLQGAVINLNVENNSIAAGDTFKVAVEIDPRDKAVNGAMIHLAFDPDSVEVLAVTLTDALPTLETPQIDNQQGLVRFGAGVLGQTRTEKFILATVTLKAKTDRVNSPLNLADTFPATNLVGPQGDVLDKAQEYLYLPIINKEN